MVPENLTNFLIVAAGASASFMGLLFVSLSVFDDKDKIDPKNLERNRILAEGSYIALINIFFVTLVALVPRANIGYAMAPIGLVGLLHAYKFRRTPKIGVGSTTIGFSLVVYCAELIFGLIALRNGSQLISIPGFIIIVIFLFSMALARAWELTGIRERR